MTLSQVDIDSLLGPEPADSVESLLDAPLTGEDISLAMQDTSYQPTQGDFLKYEEYAKTKQTDLVNTIAQAADAATSMIGGAISEGAQGAAVNPLNYVEGFAQGTRQLYGLAAQSQDPSSPLFKFKDLVAGTGTPESRYQQFLEAREFTTTTARLERGEQGIVVPPEYTNPEFVQGVSMILDPTLFIPGVGEVFGAGKMATRAVGKGTQVTGRAVAGAARPLERLAGAAERMTAEALGMTPEGLRTTAATAGIAGALGIAPEAAVFAAIPAGIRTAREAGEALARAGENLMTQPSRIGPLEAIGAAPGANMRQRMLGVIGQYGGDAAVDASLRGLAGGIEGAVIGTGLGYLSGGEEGAAAGLGSGGVQGAAGALGGRAYQKLTGAAAKEARAGDLGRFIDGQQDPTTKALFQRLLDTHGVDAASGLMDLQGLVRGKLGDVEVEYLSNEDFTKRYKISARGVQVDDKGGRPAVVINADIIGRGKGDGPLYTLGHELFHALEKSTQLQGGATEIKNALVGRWIQEGDTIRKLSEGAFSDTEIEARFNQYRDKLGAGNASMADELAQYDTINKKADYVASELAAEHFAGLLAGQKPDALLKGFTGLTRQLVDLALTQNASRALAEAAASIERTFGVKPTDSVLFPDLQKASPQVNAMLRDLLRARRKLDEKINIQNDKTKAVLKPEDVANPLAAKQLIELGLAEQMPDGTVRAMSNDEILARENKDRDSISAIIENTPGNSRMVDGVALGRLSPNQLSAIEQSQTVSSRMKDMIRGMNATMDAGRSLNITYSAALKKMLNRLTGKQVNRYSSGIRLSDRDMLPYSFYFSKAANPVVKAIDISKVRDAILKDTASNGSVGKGLWDNVDGFMGDLAKYFTNLDQKEGARRSSEIFGLEKAQYLGDFVGAAEKGDSKLIRDFRLDRIGSMAPSGFRARFSEEAYQLSKNRWMPAEKLGDKSIINSEDGYRIISGAKHKLYSPDGKLIGIYDTQTQAERKADATQARLQPEVGQQQRQAGDENRQATEAGGRNRIERGQEGQGEGGAVRQAGDVIQNFDALVAAAPDVRFMPVESQPENAPVAGRILEGQRKSIDELSEYYSAKTPERAKVLKSDAIDSLSSRLINKGVPVQEANAIASKTFSKLRKGVSGAMQVISGMGLSDLSRMAGTGKPTVERRSHVNQNWLTSAFEAFATDEGLALMKAQQVATQLNKADQAKAAAGESVEAARASGVRQSTMQQGMEFVLGEMNADRKAFGTSLREDLNSPPRVYASVGEGQKFGGQGNYNVFFEWKKETPMVATSHHHYGVANGVTGIHAQGNIGDKNARSFGNPSAEKYNTLPSGKQVLDTHLLVGNQGVPDARAHQLTVSIPDSSLSGIRKVYKDKGAAGVEAELNRIAVNQMIGTKSQGKTQSFTSKEGIPPVVAIQKNRTEAYVMDPDLANVASVTIVSNSPKEVALIRKNLESAFAKNGSALPKVKVVSAESGASGNVGRKAITDEYFKLTGEQRFMPASDMASGRSVKDHGEAVDLFKKGYRIYGAPYDGMEDPIRLKKVTEIENYDPENLWAVPSKKIAAAIGIRNMPAGDREVTRAVNINDFSQDFTGQILKGQKTIETRDTLNNAMQGVLGQRIGLVRTGIKDTKVVGYATVAKQPIVYRNEAEFRRDEESHLVAPGSPYDIKKGGVKYGYELTDVVPVEPFAPKSVGRMYSVIEPKRYMPASDTDYLSAVKKGDTATAQQMVDDVANAAGYTVGPVFHRTSAKNINVFRPWVNFGTEEQSSNVDLTGRGEGDTRTYQAYLNLSNPIRVRDEGMAASNVLQQAREQRVVSSEEMASFPYNRGDDVERAYVAKVLEKNGFDGIVYENEYEGQGDSYIALKPSQIKSADPITKDNAGNVIPLSQRFKATSEDIRYMPGEATIYRAGDKTETGVKAFSSWSENKSTAEAYLDNPGFGGAVLRSEKVPLNSVLDADTTNRKGMERLARQLGFDAGTGDEWFDNGWKYPWEESKSVKEALKKSGFDAIRYPDDFPEGATSIVPLKDFAGSENNRFMPSPDSAMPGAYSFPGGYRALPGKAKGSLRLYGPAGSLIGIASSLDEAQRILRRKNK